jgi:hypothetical protein
MQTTTIALGKGRRIQMTSKVETASILSSVSVKNILAGSGLGIAVMAALVLINMAG